MTRILLEVALESAAEARIAVDAGADRIELCGALDVGGLTPSAGTIEQARSAVGVPIFCMIRPRAGGFVYDADELATMAADVRFARRAGCGGVVFGALNTAFAVDVDACRRLLDAAEGLPCVFHRAFDVTPMPLDALETIASLGFARILTSGQQVLVSLPAGRRLVRELIALAGDRIEILPGSGVRAENVRELVAETGCAQVHGAFRKSVGDMGLGERGAEFGFGVDRGSGARTVLDGDAVRRVRAVLDA